MVNISNDGRTGVRKSAGPLPPALPVSPRNGAATDRLVTGLTENDIQRAVFQHLRTRGRPGIFAFHPKNASADMAGRKRGIHVGLGVEPGVPDVIVVRYGQMYALELKTRKGKLRSAQENALRRLGDAGAVIGVAYDLDEAIAWLEHWDLLVGKAA